MRIGIGIDAHKYEKGRKLILGGVEIPYEMGLLGHSDADVLIHSIIDAILGALNKGDIGQIFPDNDEKYKDISSLVLLKEINKMYQINIENIDAVIICQSPKLLPYIEQMRTNIANVLDIDTTRISVKATTMEYMGFTGRKEGIASVSIILLQ